MISPFVEMGPALDRAKFRDPEWTARANRAPSLLRLG